MNNLREIEELTIHQMPKNTELISNVKTIKTSQSDINSSLLINIKIQELHKQHALDIHKYIQVFLYHLSIIKNKYNVITQDGINTKTMKHLSIWIMNMHHFIN